jgi:NAD(P)-dependent dehydrogenase (short-subunit alcohol dehydrogenase family)
MQPVDQPFPGLSGLRVIVTGGTRGIGAGIAQGFLRSGAQVMVCARNEPAALPAVDDRAASFTRADVRDPDQARRLIEAAADQFGGVDVVISNAGGSPPAAAATASPRFHAKVIELNLIAPLHVAQAANAVMQGQPDGGSIIMIGSVSGTRPSPGTAAYGAAKAGLHHLVTSLAIEWAPKVRVNTVVPGFVTTDASLPHYGDAGAAAAVAVGVPLGRMAIPQDVADACQFLASPRASYISGSSLTLHGGGEPPAFLSASAPERGDHRVLRSGSPGVADSGVVDSPGVPGPLPGPGGWPWLCSTFVLSLFHAVVVPSGLRIRVQPHRWIAI